MRQTRNAIKYYTIPKVRNLSEKLARTIETESIEDTIAIDNQIGRTCFTET